MSTAINSHNSTDLEPSNNITHRAYSTPCDNTPENNVHTDDTSNNIITTSVQLTVPDDPSDNITITFNDNTTYTLNVDDKTLRQLYAHLQQNQAGNVVESDTTQNNGNTDKAHKIDIPDTAFGKVESVIRNYSVKDYFIKYTGVTGAKKPPHIAYTEAVWAFIASWIGIAVVCLINFNGFYIDLGNPRDTMVIGSFGASAVLLYSAIESPLSQPRNVFGGHVLSAIVGVAFAQMPRGDNDSLIFVQAALAVSVAITVMNITRTLHPPAGATALIAVLPSPTVQSINWLYIGLPVASGASILILIAVILNNIAPSRRYPKYWI